MRKSKVLSSKMTEGSFVCGQLNVSKILSDYHITLQVNSLSSCVVINWLT